NRLAPDGRRESHTMVSNIPLNIHGCSFLGAPAELALGAQPPLDGDLARHFLTASAGGACELCGVADTGAWPGIEHYGKLLGAVLDELVMEAPATTSPT